jgi:hypothetical protein
MDEGIHDMPTCTYCIGLEVKIPCAYQCIKFFALGAMLNQNPNKTIDKPIYYVSRLMNNAEKNYTTIEKEALTMIYVVKKFKHYLLGNN